MPKETISGSGPYHVKVGWNPHGGVQAGVVVEGERSLFWTLLDGEALARLGTAALTGISLAPTVTAYLAADDDLKTKIAEELARKLVDALDVASLGNGPNGTYMGVWADLDRHGCNDLIRILRRARDSSFGRDE